jgi:hypothetical protein
MTVDDDGDSDEDFESDGSGADAENYGQIDEPEVEAPVVVDSTTGVIDSAGNE